MALAYLLHLPVPGRALLGENCICSRPRLDPLGHHIVRCWQHRTVPHDVLCRKLHAMCRSAGLAARLEPTNCLTNLDAGSQDRPDIAIEGLAPGGRVLLVDATTADPSAVTTINTFKSHRIIAELQLRQEQGESVYSTTGTTTRGSSRFDLWRLSFLAAGVRISPASSMTYVRRLVNCMASMLRDTDISSRIGAAGFLFSSHVR